MGSQCYYTPKVTAILIGMIVMGAARTVAVKFIFQLGFDKPLFVSLLYMFAQALSLVSFGGFRFYKYLTTTPTETKVEHHEHHDGSTALSTDRGDNDDSSSGIIRKTNRGQDLTVLDLTATNCKETPLLPTMPTPTPPLSTFELMISSPKVPMPVTIPASNKQTILNQEAETSQSLEIQTLQEECPSISPHNKVSVVIDESSSSEDIELAVRSFMLTKSNSSNSTSTTITHQNLIMKKAVKSEIVENDDENSLSSSNSSSSSSDEESFVYMEPLASGDNSSTDRKPKDIIPTVHQVESPRRLLLDTTNWLSSKRSVMMRTFKQQKGSKMGVTHEMIQQGLIFQRKTDFIPYYLKPTIPAFFNLANAVCRWTALQLIDASLLVMLIGGTDLILSVIAARYIRKRGVSYNRWIAVMILVGGVTFVGWAGLSKKLHEDIILNEEEDIVDEDATEGGGQTAIIGFLLVFCQCIMAVLQALSEEIFTQDANFPPLLMVGLEGLYGTIWGLIIYVPLANSGHLLNSFGEGPFIETLHILTNNKEDDSTTLGWFSIGLIVLVSITGVFNIYSTAETSAMTRNLWKNTRAILVWIIGIIAWYVSSDDDDGDDGDDPKRINFIGESLHPLYSPLQAIGFLVMCLGIYVYYTDNNNDTTSAINFEFFKQFRCCWRPTTEKQASKDIDTKEEPIEPTEHIIDHSEEEEEEGDQC